MGIEKDVLRIDALDGSPVIDIKCLISGNNMLTAPHVLWSIFPAKKALDMDEVVRYYLK